MAGKKEFYLKVAEALHNDVGRGIVRIDENSMGRLGIVSGDIIEIAGKKTTVAIVWLAHPQDSGLDIIRMDGLIRQNSDSSLGEKVKVKKADFSPARKVIIAPIRHEIRFGADFGSHLRQRLLGRPLVQGDNLSIGILGQAIPFVVANTDPRGIVQIHDTTRLEIKEKPMKVTEAPAVRYEDIGGLRDEIARVREMIELPMKHPELFEKLGITPPKGVLLFGPPGTGKTLIAKAVASESNAYFIPLNGPEIMDKFYGESERKLRDMFQEAQENAPAIIFIDEIDSIAPKREETRGEVERRVVAQLLTLMDGLTARGDVIVIAATNRQDDIDPALRRPGRFDREIEIGVPDRDGRREILGVHTRGMPLTKDVNLKEIAGSTHGFVGADLASLSREAAMNALKKILPKIDLEKEEIPVEILDELKVEKDDFVEAMKSVNPSALREVLVEVPDIKWKDIGGLKEVKDALREAVEWPLKYPESFEKMGIRPSKAVLLYGPAGCGKTLLAKAAANESEANFISVKGPQVLCVAANTSIFTDFCGVRTIEEFYNIMCPISDVEHSASDLEVIRPKKTFHTYAITDNGEFIQTEIKTLHKLHVNDCYEIEFSNNSTITGSKNQPLLTFKDNKIKWMKLEDIQPGDLIAYPARLQPFDKEISLPIPMYKHLRIVGEDNENYHARIFSTKQITKLPKYLTSDLASFLGWFVSEGSVTKDSVRICNSSKENKEEIKKLFQQFVEEERITVHNDRVIVYSTVLVKYLEEIFDQKFGAKKSYTIKCPNIISKGSNDVIRAFLRSAYKGDGYIGGEKVEYGTMSKHLAQGMCYLLTLQGIKYRFWQRKDKMYMITISGKKEIAFFKNNILESETDGMLRREYNALYKIPPVSNLLRETKTKLRLRYGKELPDGSFEHVISGRRTIGLLRLQRIMDIYKRYADDSIKETETYRTLDFIAKGNVLWTTVENKKNAKSQIMYDIETEHGSFIGGNIPLILHNSMWVGESERGVREIFKKAKQTAPTIILFDEIDALAPRRRGDVIGGSHVTETVVNQILTEMDGIESLENVIVIGATNRPDILDPSLLRPGRFDSRILVPAPDKEARLEIFKIHTREMPLEGVDLEELASRIKDYSGADIEAICREAAMIALREDIKSKKVTKEHFEQALKKIKPSVSKMDLESYVESIKDSEKVSLPAYG